MFGWLICVPLICRQVAEYFDQGWLQAESKQLVERDDPLSFLVVKQESKRRISFRENKKL
jgi:hypothetical protein